MATDVQHSDAPFKADCDPSPETPKLPARGFFDSVWKKAKMANLFAVLKQGNLTGELTGEYGLELLRLHDFVL
jgi:hypothetical protein